MGIRGRLTAAVTAAVTLVIGLLAGAIPAGASSAPHSYVIGVDNATPAGHNFEYVDYFPRGSVSEDGAATVVGNGAVVDFKWIGTGDSLHTATLLPRGMTPTQAWQKFPLITVDASDLGPGAGPPPLAANNAVFAPNLPCGHSAATACVYDGAGLINSGANANSGDLYVQLSLPTRKPTNVRFVCLIHPGMQGSVRVVPGRGSSPSEVAERAARQYASDTEGAMDAEAEAGETAASTRTIIAGTATRFVEVAEMLPRDVTVKQGHQLTWVTQSIKDPHTVTFPQGHGSDSVDPFLPPVCETAGGDVPATFPGGVPCGNPANFEQPFDAAPHGGSTINSLTIPVTSGIVASFPPFGNSVTFSFSEMGTFTYQCRIHDHMVGTVLVGA